VVNIQIAKLSMDQKRIAVISLV